MMKFGISIILQLAEKIKSFTKKNYNNSAPALYFNYDFPPHVHRIILEYSLDFDDETVALLVRGLILWGLDQQLLSSPEGRIDVRRALPALGWWAYTNPSVFAGGFSQMAVEYRLDHRMISAFLHSLKSCHVEFLLIIQKCAPENRSLKRKVDTIQMVAIDLSITKLFELRFGNHQWKREVSLMILATIVDSLANPEPPTNYEEIKESILKCLRQLYADPHIILMELKRLSRQNKSVVPYFEMVRELSDGDGKWEWIYALHYAETYGF